MKTILMLIVLVISYSGNLVIAEEYDVWIGTDGEYGIHHLTLDATLGKMYEANKVAELNGAGFLAVNKSGKKIYSTGRIDDQGCVVAFDVERVKSGTTILEPIGHKTIPDNHHPAHISLDRQERFLLAAQYSGGSIAVFGLNSTGEIGELKELIEHQGASGVFKNRQDNPHPHWIGVDTTNQVVAVPDLGKDQVVRYKLDSVTGRLTEVAPWPVPPGSGPRHMKFHSNGEFAYVLNEFSMSISVFAGLSGQTAIEHIQDIKSLPDSRRDKRHNSAAEIRIHPNGKFLYASNRGHDSISVFSLNSVTGKLQFIEHESIRGSWPRNFDISPCGNWLIAAGKLSNTLSLFEIGANGRLEFTRGVINVPGPICVAFSKRQ